MKKVGIILITICAILILSNRQSEAQAMGQDYQLGLGLKLGYWGGAAIDGKYFTDRNHAIEAIVGFDSDWLTITGLYEIHGDITDAPGLKWYVGPGAHLGFWDSHYKNSGVFLGVDGVVGLDYKFTNAPVDLGLDLQPSISFPHGGFNFWGGLSLRFTL